jgi:hypothetical protein
MPSIQPQSKVNHTSFPPELPAKATIGTQALISLLGALGVLATLAEVFYCC